MPRPLDSAKVYFKHMCLSGQQEDAITDLYRNNEHCAILFSDVESASSFAKTHGLDDESRARPSSRWSVCWGNKWAQSRRILVQCGCGYSTDARQVKEGRHSSYKVVGAKSTKKWQRLAPYDYTGCLAHADLTYRGGILCRVVGYLCHNDACRTAVIERTPSMPLHPSVIGVALAQLRDGASVTSVEMKNIRLSSQCLYTDQASNTNFRYQILPHDFSRLYRRISREKGVDVGVASEINVDGWLRPGSKTFKHAFDKATFHYSPRTLPDERFILCIATEEMDNAAWKYCHRSQLILDGTFGVSSSRLLLFIAMAVDGESRGVPIAFFFFSAPSGNRAVQAGYDSSILKEVLQAWHDHLGTRNGESFTPLVCITDTDTKERLAVGSVWPLTIQLLCRFHVIQCWSNKRRTLFRGKGYDPLMQILDSQLQRLENQLFETNQREDALSLIAEERSLLSKLSSFKGAEAASIAGIEHVDYLEHNWLREGLYTGWSRKGRELAAQIIGAPIKAILTTTNHLESFNNILKKKYIKNFQHSQCRLRFDLLLYYLVTEILPYIYSRRDVLSNFRSGSNLALPNATARQCRSKSCTNKQSAAKESAEKVAWYEMDEKRDIRARYIVSHSLLSTTKYRTDEVLAMCVNPTKTVGALFDIPVQAHHIMTAHVSGAGTCSCPDWLTHSGACKHLRALRIFIEGKKAQGDQYYIRFHFPSSEAEALGILRHNKLLYGEHFGDYIALPQNGALIGSVPGDLPPPSEGVHPNYHTAGGDTNLIAGSVEDDQAQPNHNPSNNPGDDFSTSLAESDATQVALPSDQTFGIFSSDFEMGDHGENTQSFASSTQNGTYPLLQGRTTQRLRRVLPTLHGLLQDMKDLGDRMEYSEDVSEFFTLLREFDEAVPDFRAAKRSIHECSGVADLPESSVPTEECAFAVDTVAIPVHQEAPRGRTKRRRLLGPSPTRNQKRLISGSIF